jgi:hypothetical protein
MVKLRVKDMRLDQAKTRSLDLYEVHSYQAIR